MRSSQLTLGGAVVVAAAADLRGATARRGVGAPDVDVVVIEAAAIAAAAAAAAIASPPMSIPLAGSYGAELAPSKLW